VVTTLAAEAVAAGAVAGVQFSVARWLICKPNFAQSSLFEKLFF